MTTVNQVLREAKWTLNTKIDISDIPTGHQDRDEIMWLLERVAGAESILEIGTAEGSTLLMFARVAAPGARIRSIDNVASPMCVDRIASLRQEGVDIAQKIGDSTAPDTIEWARQNGPYDLIFIDASHGPEVWIEWSNYKSMATQYIALHDISFTHPYVRSLWDERIKPTHKTEEILNDPNQSGIGLVVLENHADH